MHIRDICTPQAITCTRDDTVQGVALLMRKHHIGDLIVVDSANPAIPVGIVTDRDIVVSVIALGLDPAGLLAGDIMSDDLLTCRDEDDVYQTIEHMRLRGIRRVPVVNADGHLSGIVSVDDLLAFLAAEMGDLSRISANQQAHERLARH